MSLMRTYRIMMSDKFDKNKFSVDDFIAFIDTFFVLWEDKEDFRSHIIIYLATLKHIKDFATNDNLDDHIQAKFQRLYTLLRDIELLPISAADDPAYEDHLIEPKKLWQQLRP